MKYLKYLAITLAFTLIGVGIGLLARQVTEDDALTSTNPVVIDDQSTSEEQKNDTASQTARYKVTFDATWSQDTHSRTFPTGAHMSPMIVAIHTNSGSLFRPGAEATPGIQQVAELGATDLIEAEIADNSDFYQYKKGARIDVPGTDSIEIEATQGADLLSFISMLAPSPDWIVTLNSIDLFDGDISGDWLQSSAYTVEALDAGTQDGGSHTSASVPTTPQETVSQPRSVNFLDASLTPFGTVTVERIDQ